MSEGLCIIWDWNGTLLDDLTVSHRIFNQLMSDRSLPAISLSAFRDLYTHPIIDMYHAIGFPFSPAYTFDDLCRDWYLESEKQASDVSIFADGEETLRSFHRVGAHQIIISALNHDILLSQVRQYGVSGYFARISGNDDMRADSKVERSVQVFVESGMPLSRTWVIGDTLHDAAMAQAIGCQCVLVERGYEPKKKLESSGFPVLDSLANACKLITEQS